MPWDWSAVAAPPAPAPAPAPQPAPAGPAPFDWAKIAAPPPTADEIAGTYHRDRLARLGPGADAGFYESLRQNADREAGQADAIDAARQPPAARGAQPVEVDLGTPDDPHGTPIEEQPRMRAMPPPTTWEMVKGYAGALAALPREAIGQTAAGLAGAMGAGVQQLGGSDQPFVEASGDLARETEQATSDLTGRAPGAAKAAQLIGGVLPAMTPVGLATLPVTMGGSAYTGAREDGATPGQALSKGALVGTVAALVPGLGRYVAPVTKAAGEAVAETVAPAVGQRVAGAVGGAVEHGAEGVGAGTALGTADAVGTAIYDPARALEQAQDIPNQALTLGALGAFTGGAGGAMRRGAPRAPAEPGRPPVDTSPEAQADAPGVYDWAKVAEPPPAAEPLTRRPETLATAAAEPAPAPAVPVEGASHGSQESAPVQEEVRREGQGEVRRPVDEEGRQSLLTPAPAEPAAAGGDVGSFTTAKGSTYAVDEQGRTQRTKSDHSAVGHDKADVGEKPASERTYYMDPREAGLLGGHQSMQGAPGHGTAVMVKDGRAYAVSWNEQAGRWGVSPDMAQGFALTDHPEVGKSPLELWASKSGKPSMGQGDLFTNWHPGNAITEVRPKKGQDVPGRGPGEQPAPTADPVATAPPEAHGVGGDPLRLGPDDHSPGTEAPLADGREPVRDASTSPAVPEDRPTAARPVGRPRAEPRAHDIIDDVRDLGGIREKPHGYQGGEYDDAPGVPGAHSYRGTESRDVIATRLHEQGIGDGTVNGLWKSIEKASAERLAAKRRPVADPKRTKEGDEPDLSPIEIAAIRGRYGDGPEPFQADRLPGDTRPTPERAAARPVADSKPTETKLAAGEHDRGELRQSLQDDMGRIGIAKPEKPGDVRPLRKTVGDLADWLGAQVFKTKGGRGGGSYDPASGAIAMRRKSDLDTTAHEVGHWLDDRFQIIPEGVGDAFDHELDRFSPYGSKPPGGSEEFKQRYRRAEGVAEFMRAWMINPKVAEQSAPQLAARIESVVPKAVRDRLAQFGREVQTFHHAPAVEAGAANIRQLGDTGPTLGDRLRDAVLGKKPQVGAPLRFGVRDWLRVRWTNRLHPLLKALDWAGQQRAGGALDARKAYTLIRLLAGANDRSTAISRVGMIKAKWLKDGTVQRAEGVEGGIDWLGSWADTSSEASIRRDMRDLGSYMVAQRTLEQAGHIDAERIAEVRKLAGEAEARYKAEKDALEPLADQVRTRAKNQAGRFGGAVDRLGDIQETADQLTKLSDRDLAKIQDAAEQAAAEPVGDMKLSTPERAARIGREAQRLLEAIGKTYQEVPRGTKGMAAIRARLVKVAERAGKVEGMSDDAISALETEARGAARTLAEAARRRATDAVDELASKARESLHRRQDYMAKSVLRTVEAISRGTAGLAKDAERTISEARSRVEMNHLSRLLAIQRQAKRWEIRDEHAKARLSGQGGGTRADDLQAARIVAEATTDRVRHARLEEGARRYRAWANGVLRYLVDKGRLSEEQYSAITKRNEHYVAMQRILDDQADLAPRPIGGGKVGVAKQVAHSFKGSQREIDNPIANLVESTMKAVGEADRNEAMRAVTDLLRDNRWLHDGKAPDLASVGVRLENAGPGTVKVYREGEEEHWKFVPEVESAIKGLGDQYRLPSPLTILPRMLRAGVVNSPMFAILNRLRDTQARLIIGKGAPDTLAGWLPHLLRQIPGVERLQQGEKDRVEAAGGAFSGHYLRSKEDWHKASEKAIRALRKDRSTVVTTLAKAGGAYMKLIQNSEFSGRANEFQAVYRREFASGVDEQSAAQMAALAARDLVDFAEAGTHAAVVNQLVPFFNAAIQGLRSTKRAALRDPAGFLARWGMFALAPTLATYGLAAAGSDKDLEEYRNLPAWRRDLFFNIKVGPDSWLTIPKPFELGVFASGVERSLDAGYQVHKGTDPQAAITKAFDGYGGSLSHSMLPVDSKALVGSYQAIVETFMANKDFYTGKPIVPEYEKDLPVDQRPGAAHASRVGQLGQYLSAGTVDGRQVDHLVRGIFGGLGGLAAAASDLGRPDKPGAAGFLTKQATGVLRSGVADQQQDVQRLVGQEAADGHPRSRPVQTIAQMTKSYWQAATGAEREKLSDAMRDYAEGRDPMLALDRAAGAAADLRHAMSAIPDAGKGDFAAANADALGIADQVSDIAREVSSLQKNGGTREQISRLASLRMKGIRGIEKLASSAKAARGPRP